MLVPTDYCYGVEHKATLALLPFLCIVFPIGFLIIPYSSTSAVWQLLAETSSSKARETTRNGREILPKKYAHMY
jgi:hypothetical protein